MSGSLPKPGEGSLADQHLGDRLAALVDGELGHATRERVLAHLATCPKCKAEADAQRRLKNVFAEAAPPPPSESFLARLQGLPGGDPEDGDSSPFGGGGLGGLSGRPGAGAFGVRRGERFEFDYVPARPHAPMLPPAASRGFRIHDVSRHETDRSASRGMRFAFVAAGAVSLAAIALAGVTTGAPGDTEARGAGSNVTPARAPGTGAAVPENQRRRGVGPLLAQEQGQRMLGDTPVAPTEASAPLLPGVPAQVREAALHTLTAPVVAGAAAMSPLIRPLSATPPLTLTSLSATPDLTTSGFLAAPVPHTTSAPPPTAAR
ncbi:membrane protein [Streptomyces sp. TUS-ST3]|uniref:anti-sigma factor family protein n=1 Tax=Streptomyces sp. TUS-ST3 TaxID=3025591 RepID=UPI00235B3E09|nr:zf-HC2 domain-containing protein [Streptomyces sp. TUS-ST3]GLP68184.1 membrane protein [Streptomyces sp. TUS-ST3]